MESVKAVTALYTAEELITKRDSVKTEIQNKIIGFLNETLEEKELTGLLKIAMSRLPILISVNLIVLLKKRYGNKSVESKNEKQSGYPAEAKAEEQKLIADAAAYEIEVESKARAEAIKRESEAAGNPQLIQLRIAEKWDGQLPRFSGGDTVSFISRNFK